MSAPDYAAQIREAIADYEARRLADLPPAPAPAPAPATTPAPSTVEPQPEPEPAPEPEPEPSKVDARALAESIQRGTADSDARPDIRDIARRIRGFG